MSNLIKVYGKTFEIECKDCEAYMIINDGGTETNPSHCAYCGSKNIITTDYETGE